MIKLNVCEWCWFNVFKSDYEICPICNYQNSIWWLLNPFEKSCNWDLTLIDYQKWTLENIWHSIKEYKKWIYIYYRDRNWRPININHFDKNHDYFPKYFFDTLIKSDTSFYKNQLKLFKEAQTYNPDKKVHLEL